MRREAAAGRPPPENFTAQMTKQGKIQTRKLVVINNVYLQCNFSIKVFITRIKHMLLIPPFIGDYSKFKARIIMKMLRICTGPRSLCWAACTLWTRMSSTHSKDFCLPAMLRGWFPTPRCIHIQALICFSSCIIKIWLRVFISSEFCSYLTT